MQIDFELEVKGKGKSSYTAEMINHRLLVLKGKKPTTETEREIRYLEQLRSKEMNLDHHKG